jgi:hypothetical protein
MFAISCASIVALLRTFDDPRRDVDEPSFFVLWSMSAAYFIGDVLYLLYLLLVVDPGTDNTRALVLAHHSVALAALGFMFAFAEFRIFMVVTGLQEISTFFMFFKRIESMRSWKRETELAFLFTWVLFRALLSPFLVVWATLYLVHDARVVSAVHLSFHTFFLACNVYWSIQIIQSRLQPRREGVEV